MERVIESIVQQGRIVGRVRDEFGTCAPIVGARVSIYARATTSGKSRRSRGAASGAEAGIDLSRRRPDFVVTTGPDGEFDGLRSGYYFVVCDAYGERPTQEVEVGAGCPSEVDFLIPVGLEVRSDVTREDCGPYVPCDVVTAGTVVAFRAEHRLPEGRIPDRKFIWTVSRGTLIESPDPQAREYPGADRRAGGPVPGLGDAQGQPGGDGEQLGHDHAAAGAEHRRRRLRDAAPDGDGADGGPAALARHSEEHRSDLFRDNYSRFMDLLLCGLGQKPRRRRVEPAFNRLLPRRLLPYNDADAYRLLKVATEAFLMVNCGVLSGAPNFTQADLDDAARATSAWTAGSSTSPRSMRSGNLSGDHQRRARHDDPLPRADPRQAARGQRLKIVDLRG